MFTVEQANSIVRGLASWTDAVPQLTLDVTIARCDATEDVCVLPVALPPTYVGKACTGFSSHEGHRFIEIDTVQDLGLGWLLQRTVAHEMGHAMGLDHSGAGSLMAAWVGDQVEGPVMTDIAQWFAVRK